MIYEVEGDIWLWGGNGKRKVLNLITDEATGPDLDQPSRPNKIAVHRALRAVNKMRPQHNYCA